MKPIKNFTALILLIIGLTCCESDELTPDLSLYEDQFTIQESDMGGVFDSNAPMKTTGFLEVLWKGAEKGSDMGNKPDALLCFFDFNAHEENLKKPAKGEIVFTVLEPDSSLHREIMAEVYGVHIDPVDHKAWIVASVVSDSKGCGGNGSGGHDEGCSSGSHDDGEEGCSGDDTSHDGGCSHDDTGTDGTVTHDDSGGCSGGSETGEDHEGSGGAGTPGGEDKGNPLSGKNCRIGQIIAVKAHDGGTPGTDNDGITWKWFSPEGYFVPTAENISQWPHLCKKTIIGGNLSIHE